MSRVLGTRFYAVAATVLFLSGFTACTKTSEHRVTTACAAEVQQFCASVQPGNGRVVSCLDEHLSELSPACEQFQASRRGGVACTDNETCSDGHKGTMKTATSSSHTTKK